MPDTQKVLIVYGYTTPLLFNPESNGYTSVTTQGSNGNEYAAGAVWHENKLWLAGNFRSTTDFKSVTGDGADWTTEASNPFGLAFHDMILVGDYMLTFGGKDQNIAFSTRINMYNISSQTWSVAPFELPIPLSGASTKLVGPSAYVFGGVTGNGADMFLNDKMWIVPCINPSVCEFGCNQATGQCKAAPEYTPTSAPDTAPGDSPISAPGSSPGTAPGSPNTPSGSPGTPSATPDNTPGGSPNTPGTANPSPNNIPQSKTSSAIVDSATVLSLLCLTTSVIVFG